MANSANRRLSTGIGGLDEILQGGFLSGRTYLVRGGPGCGKTTLGMHFLTNGASAGEKVLYISLGEPEAQLLENGTSLGFDLRDVTFLDLSPDAAFFAETESYDIFSPADVEKEPMTAKIIEAIETLKPRRIFIDSMTQFRYLSTDSFQYRKQTLSFLRYLVDHGGTVVFTSEGTSEIPDDDLQFMADGIINLELAPEGRMLSVTKFRGSYFEPGEHSMRLSEKGMELFPRLVPERQRRDFVAEAMSSGVPELDELLHGGLERGTATIITGPSGVGKTTLGLQFIKDAAGRGEHSAVYTFEEGASTLVNRCDGINIPVRDMVRTGALSVFQIEPMQYMPGQFARFVQTDVTEKKRRIVMIDSVAGYGLTMHGRDLVTNLHALVMYLKSVGVTILLVNEIQNITGEFKATDDKLSYLADNVVFLRYVEVGGSMEKAIGVLKKRAGDFEKNLRRINITRYGLKVGKPLTGLRGILSGNPEIVEEDKER